MNCFKTILKMRNNMNGNLLLLITALASITILGCSEPEKEFVDYEVAFFKDSPYLSLTPEQYETVAEEKLVRDAHNEGATFQTVTEQILTKEASGSYEISKERILDLVVDCSVESTIPIQCMDFYTLSEVIQIDIPAQYSSRTYETVLVNGTGILVPAQYETTTFQRFIRAAEITPLTNAFPTTEVVNFRLPAGTSISEYIHDNFMEKLGEGCFEFVSYRVL